MCVGIACEVRFFIVIIMAGFIHKGRYKAMMILTWTFEPTDGQEEENSELKLRDALSNVVFFFPP